MYHNVYEYQCIIFFSFTEVRVNFNPTLYPVTEGDTVTLMLVLSSPSDSPVSVQVLTNPGSATGKRERNYAVRSLWLVHVIECNL